MLPFHDDYDNTETFDEAFKVLQPKGFVDSTWTNDACPSMCLMNHSDTAPVCTLYIDYANPLSRESQHQSEYAVVWHGQNGDADMWTSHDTLVEVIDHIEELLVPSK